MKKNEHLVITQWICINFVYFIVGFALQ